MIGINTESVVALMKNLHSVRNLSEVNYPRNSMSVFSDSLSVDEFGENPSVRWSSGTFPIPGKKAIRVAVSVNSVEPKDARNAIRCYANDAHVTPAFHADVRRGLVCGERGKAAVSWQCISPRGTVRFPARTAE